MSNDFSLFDNCVTIGRKGIYIFQQVNNSIQSIGFKSLQINNNLIYCYEKADI